MDCKRPLPKGTVAFRTLTGGSWNFRRVCEPCMANRQKVKSR